MHEVTMYSMKAALKAFSLEHVPHIMRVTSVRPAGASCEKNSNIHVYVPPDCAQTGPLMYLPVRISHSEYVITAYQQRGGGGEGGRGE